MVMNQGAFRDMLSSVRGEEKAKALDVDLPPQFGRAHGSNLRVALVGRPNAGCSTLFNAFCGRRAAASGFPGETRRANVGRTPHATEAYEALRACYAPRAERPVTFSVVDAPSRNALDVKNDGNDDPALLEGLWAGASTADVVVVVVRDFRTGDVTHTSETIDAARDLKWIGEVAKRRDVVILEKRIKELEKLRAGNWLRGEKEALQYAVKLLVSGPDPPKQESDDGLSSSDEDKPPPYDPDDPKWRPRLTLRSERWSDDEVKWLASLDLLTTKPWVVLVNGDQRHYLMGYQDPRVLSSVSKVGAELGVASILPGCAIFERKLQDLREAPTLEPTEEHFETISPYDEYVRANPDHRSSRNAILDACRDALQLICVYACCDDEVRGICCRDGDTVKEYCLGLHEVVGRNFDVAEVCDAAKFKQLKSEEAVRRAGNVRRVGAEMILEHEQVVFVAFDLPQDAGRMAVAWSCDPRAKTGRKVSENFRYELEYEAQFAEAPKEEVDVAAIRAEDFLEDEGSFDSGASDTA